ncbi:MAG: hypothetical protein U0165_19340 [Polyangiaceae bacterium]
MSSNADEVAVLPSSDVRDVIPTSDGGAIFVCGRERLSPGGGDRLEQPIFELNGEQRQGGIAIVDASGAITSSITEGLGDPRAAALQSDGSLLILDAEKGVVKLSNGAVTSAQLPAALPSGAIPRGLWISATGDLVATSSSGAVVSFGGAVLSISDAGTTWVARPGASNELLVGSDEGLVRVFPSNASAGTEPAIGDGFLPSFKQIDPPGSGGGQCAAAGESCSSQPNGCCPGLTCSSGIIPTCE